ncbi:MAG: lysophospholipase [Leptospira sp.]|nr:lysophospholipase [Leptospira sp.]
MSYKNEESHFNSSKDGTKIFYQSWTKTKPGAGRVLVFQHGFGEHSGRYGNLLDKFKDSNVNFYALDSRGHGRSEGKRGHVDQFQNYIDDLTEFIDIVKEREKANKIFLLGHSLGGVIVLQYTIEGVNQNNLHALIVSSPAIRVKMNLERQIKKAVARVFAYIMPAVTLDAKLDVKFLSHDLGVVKAYTEDPLVHGMISFQMASNLFNLSRSIRDKAKIIRVPVLLFHGEQDGIADVEGSKELNQSLLYKNKKFKIYPGLYHETMNELPKDREIVLNDIKDFVDSIVRESIPVQIKAAVAKLLPKKEPAPKKKVVAKKK